MSEPNTDQPAASAQPNTPVPKPSRSPVERVIVWGAIAIGLLLVALEGHARYGYTWTLNALEAELKEDDGAEANPLLLSEVPGHIVGWPSQSDDTEMHRQTLTWRGFFKSYEIYVSYSKIGDEAAAVLGIETKDAPPVPPPPHVEDVADEMTEAMNATTMGGGPPGGGGGRGPGGGGGGGFDPWRFDVDGDREISREEASERMQENWESLDTNGDDTLDEEEVNAMLARRGQRGGGDRPQRPDRPELESDGNAEPAGGADPGSTETPDAGSPGDSAAADPAPAP